METTYSILIGKSEWKRPLGRYGRRSEDNIKWDLKEVGRVGVDWIHLAQDRISGGLFEDGNEPSDCIEDWEFLD
jgi:hypothetical protein